ncbi:site-specific DNA-methyltransferase [Marinilongibacter aquaticus]|uniref:site-specific DNA-methyltransferase n=1 Tax=Marinilongibacter aquaticus TaxID=2975157 RepID=UPI0021BDAE40|nr:site-specific DNA-methyltransferase [Marinilongibacter aquaticus]UBM57166.1 site-specific DNA-methyltransferase [Marinilongibacter aquaticus]
MPTLHWIGKDKVVSHHQDVPYRVLEHKYGFTADKSEPTNSGNKIIHGDNLEALKSLLPEYEGKIKCIYIDPPYNTGNENWVYNDNVNHPKIKKWLGEVVGKDGEDLSRHDKWLCMMYPRLKLLHKLLANDGAIFISIDDNEQANLKLICDEIFGVRNFINNIIWQKKYSPQNDARYLSDMHDFVLCYAKSKDSWKRNLLPRTEAQNKRYKNPDNDIRGPWKSSDLSVKTYSKLTDYEIETPSGRIVSPPNGRCWGVNKEKLQELIQDNRIWFGKDGKNVPSVKKFMNEVQQGTVPLTLWLREEVGDNQEAKQDLKVIMGKSNFPFDTPKPSRLVERVLQLSSDKNSIILDSFAGSGTTAHAVLNLNKQDGGNRKFILVEMEDYANDITAERVKRVTKGYGSGNKKVDGTGGAFDFYELGLPLFDENQNLNEEVGLLKIREYIWFSETRTSFTEPNAENYFLGKKEDSAYYFIYEKDRLTTLDYDALELIKTKGEQYIIYADNCLLPKEFMAKKNIIFKKIPRDITRF